ncbi:ash family protein [Vibrio neonatus]|uniref:ash family protein n=1 Tax=Vibrio neonatus TaxID=278860 RepID=UPI0021C2D803|nr:ash family protein [Vibrio neonatus]
MNILNYAENPQGLGLPKESLGDRFINTKAKSLVGIGTPFNSKAHRRQHLAGFFMRKISAHLYNSLAELYQNYGGLIEATSVGRFLAYGSSNLFQSTTSSRLEPLRWWLKPTQGDGHMTTTPTQATPKTMIYTFLVARKRQKLSNLKRVRTVSVVAQSEPLARKQLDGMPLVFVRQSPAMGGQHYV